MMKKVTSMFFVLVIVVLCASFAHADEDSGWVYITKMGGAMDNGTTFIVIDGPAVGGSYGCSSQSIRWTTDEDDVNYKKGGKNLLFLLSSAYLNGDQIRFGVNSCYDNDDRYPTLKSVQIRPAP